MPHLVKVAVNRSLSSTVTVYCRYKDGLPFGFYSLASLHALHLKVLTSVISQGKNGVLSAASQSHGRILSMNQYPALDHIVHKWRPASPHVPDSVSEYHSFIPNPPEKH